MKGCRERLRDESHPEPRPPPTQRPWLRGGLRPRTRRPGSSDAARRGSPGEGSAQEKRCPGGGGRARGFHQEPSRALLPRLVCASVSQVSGGGVRPWDLDCPAAPDLPPQTPPPGAALCGPPLSSSPRCHLGLTRAGANAKASSQQQSVNTHLLPKGPQGHVLPHNARGYRMGKTQSLRQALGAKDLHKTAHKATLPRGA